MTSIFKVLSPIQQIQNSLNNFSRINITKAEIIVFVLIVIKMLL